MDKTKGLIFDIQGYSVHDGPGCRTLVFLTGCPLRCEWCANPEGWEKRKKILYSEAKCTSKTHNCTRCIEKCPNDAISLNEDKKIKIDFKKCISCNTFECADVCSYEAIRVCGKEYTVKELMKVINRDRQYWGSSGGVTFTGGEPMVQKDFLIAMLKRCKEAYVHTAIETCSHVPTENFKEIIKYIDFMFMDIKHMDPEIHKQKTGATNELILKNIEVAAKEENWKGRLVLRIPLIPEFNDTEENMLATAAFMKKNNLHEVNILPFHRLGDSKWTQLGKVYPYRDCQVDQEDVLKKFQSIFINQGINCYISSDTPF